MRLTNKILVCALLGVGMPVAFAEADWEQRAPLCDLNAEMQNARRNLRQPDEAELTQKKHKLTTAMTELDRLLQRSGPGRLEGWHRYLKWDELKSQIGQLERGNAAALRAILDLFFQPHEGLEMQQFTNLRDQLRTYVAVLEGVQDRSFSVNADRRLSVLRNNLSGADPGAIDATDMQQIADAVSWFADMERAAGLTTCLRSRFGYGNVRIQVSDKFLFEDLFEPISEQSPVRDYAFGAQVSGTSWTTAQPRIDFVPNNSTADVRVQLSGNAHTRTVSAKGRVRVYSTMQTQLYANQRLGFSANKVTTYQPYAQCRTSGRIDSVSAGTRIVQRIAWRRAQNTLPAALQRANQQANQKVSRRLSTEVAGYVSHLNGVLDEYVANPLRRLGYGDPVKQTKTSDHSLFAILRAARHSQLSAPVPPPRLSSSGDISVSLHETVFANTMGYLFGGETFKDVDIDAFFRMIGEEVPDELRIVPGRDDWSLVLEAKTPVAFEFRGNNEIALTLMIREFVRRDMVTLNGPTQRLSGLTKVKVHYRAAVKDDQLVLSRLASPEIEAAGGASSDLLRFMQRKVNATFAETISLEPIALSNALVRSNGSAERKLRFAYLDSARGWLQLGMNL